MSCVRDTSPSADSKSAEENGKESKKRRFHPFRGLRRIFRRKARASERGTAGDSDSAHASHEALSPDEQPRDSPQCSRSASQLIPDSSQARRSLHSTVLSVSHDSIFSPDIHPESQLGSGFSVHKLGHPGIRAELFDAVRRRKGRDDTSEEDLGLPQSPLSSSLTPTDALADANQDVRITKSPHSNCSDGSLLSMGSSEMDDDFYGHASRNSSKLSLYDRESLNQDSADTGVDLNASVASTQLSHSAARHKMAIKPKRTHGAPRRNKQLAAGSVLPSTPELNEDVINRNLSSQTSDSVSTIALATSSEPSADIRIKSASLPSGLSPVSASSVKLTRSQSNAAYLGTNDNISEEEDGPENNFNQITKKDENNSFFGRLLSRRSGKKKKTVNKDSLTAIVPPKRLDDKGRYVHEISNVSVKHYPATRQRVDPINIPSDCNPIVSRMHISYPLFPPAHSDLESGVVVLSISPSDKVEVVHTRPVMHDLPDVLKPVKKSYSFRRNDHPSYSSLDSLSLPITVNSVADDIDNPSSDAVENKLGVRNVSITEEMVPKILLSGRNAPDSSASLTSSSSSEFEEITPDSGKVIILADSKPEIKDTNNVKSIEISSSPTSDGVDIVKSSHNQVSTIILSESPETIKSDKDFCHPTKTKIKNCANIVIPDSSSSDYLSRSPKFSSSYPPKSPKTPTPVSPSEDANKLLEEILPPISPRNIDTFLKSPKVPGPVLPPIPAPRTSILKKEAENPVPEFMKIQLNRIENKSSSNVILSTSPEKSEKSEKCEKSEKSEKSENLEQTVKTERPEKFDKPERFGKQDIFYSKKIDKSDKPEKIGDVEISSSKKPEKVGKGDITGRKDLDKVLKCEKSQEPSEVSPENSASNMDPSQADKPIITEAIHKPNVASKSPLSYAPHKFTVNTRQWSSVNSKNIKSNISHTSEIIASQRKDDKKLSDEILSKPVLSSSIKVILRSHSSVDEESLKFCDRPVRSSSTENLNETITVYNDSKPLIKSEVTKSKATEKSDLSKSKPAEKLNVSKSKAVEMSLDLQNVNDKLNANEHSCLKPEGCTNVVLRGKSETKDLRSGKDDEPELLKVFARRSLKIKDSDLVESVKLADNKSESVTKSRDSDKENEEVDSPSEERKFKELSKCDLENETSSKHVFNFISNVNNHFTRQDSYSLLNMYSSPTKYQRSLSHNSDDLSNSILLLSNQREKNINNAIFEKRQRSKTLPDLQVQKNVSNTLFLNENDNNIPSDNFQPETTQKFKRIQQRAEEWERRAQLTMKKASFE